MKETDAQIHARTWAEWVAGHAADVRTADDLEALITRLRAAASCLECTVREIRSAEGRAA